MSLCSPSNHTLFSALLFGALAIGGCGGEPGELYEPDGPDEVTFTFESPADIERSSSALLSGINGYQWWDITATSVYNLDSRVRPTIIGNNTYFASGGWFNNGQGWYMGLQQKGDGTRTLHAAIWDSTSAVAGASATCSNFDGEGVGKKCWRNYNWSTITSGFYRLRIWRLEEDANGRWWGFWVITPSGTELYIGKIRARTDADFIKNNTTQDHYNFIENWSHGSYATCSAVPDARYYVLWPRFNNDQVGSVRMGISETNCVDVVKESTTTRLEISL